ncbi:MAG TPA: diguanylate cyclase [Leptolyngbyaceae cyanobacterium M65_K2018_010]|nr:diguanylate cyclase [Leptolyngbyaceae cyanobacterium M65_K2018_010]
MTLHDTCPALGLFWPQQGPTATPSQGVGPDLAPLKLDGACSLRRGLQAMARAGKVYALVYQDQQLIGLFTYENAAQASFQGTDFDNSALGDWMTPIALFRSSPEFHLDPGAALIAPETSDYLPLVNANGHCLGFLTAEGVYARPIPDQGLQSCTTSLMACQQSSAQLQASQERLTLALQGAQMGTLNWNLAANTWVVSEELQRLLELGPEEFDGHSETLFKHIHPEDQARVHQVLHQAIRHQEHYTLEFRVVLPDGSVRWLLSQGQGFGDSPLSSRLAGVTLDISAQKRAEAELKLQAQRERLMGEIAQRIRALLDLDSILQQTVISVREFIAADRVIILQRGADRSGQVIQESCNPDYPTMQGWAVRDPWSLDAGCLPQYRQGRGLAIANIHEQGLSADQLSFLDYFQIQAEVVIPLLQEDALWGLLIVHQCSGPRQWQSAEVSFLENLATQVGIAIQQAKLHRQLTQANRGLRRMAYLDGLTKVANRRRFEQHLEGEWRRMARLEAPLSIILADIDYFKDFNDLYGHQAGDNCLRLVARTLSRAAKRPGDLVARYGGEEFVVVLPNTDLQGAETVAEEMRQAIRDRRINHQRSAIAPMVTMSLGVASCVPTATTTSSALLKRADEALYRAKHNGRDQVRLAPD